MIFKGFVCFVVNGNYYVGFLGWLSRFYGGGEVVGLGDLVEWR